MIWTYQWTYQCVNVIQDLMSSLISMYVSVTHVQYIQGIENWEIIGNWETKFNYFFMIFHDWQKRMSSYRHYNTDNLVCTCNSNTKSVTIHHSFQAFDTKFHDFSMIFPFYAEIFECRFVRRLASTFHSITLNYILWPITVKSRSHNVKCNTYTCMGKCYIAITWCTEAHTYVGWIWLVYDQIWPNNDT